MIRNNKLRRAVRCILLAGCLVGAQNLAFAAATPRAAAETLIFDGKAMPLGAGQASDPSLFNLNGQWLSIFTTVGWKSTCPAMHGYSFVIRETGAALPAGKNLGTAVNNWQVLPDGAGSYAQFLRPGPSGSWDEDAIESPKLTNGYDPTQGKNVTRIYYTGWRRVQTGTDASGCPIFGYQDWKIGMAEFSAASGQWVKRAAPVLDGANAWEQIHYIRPDGTRATYTFIGDQSVIYIAGTGSKPGAWHMYYQATTDYPSLRVVTIHATSTDGVTWPAANRAILSTHPPSPTALLPGGPYSIDVTMINGKLYFVGWVPNQDPSQQGLWMVSSTTPDGKAAGDFSKWTPLLYDNNGTWWHSADAQSLLTHEAGLFAPTLVHENGALWLYYSGTRKDADGIWTSVGRALVDPAVLR